MFKVAKSAEVQGKNTVALSKAQLESQRARAEFARGVVVVDKAWKGLRTRTWD